MVLQVDGIDQAGVRFPVGPQEGEMAERLKAALLKSAIPKGIVSSNLTLSAKIFVVR
jgi:hypothetical protein